MQIGKIMRKYKILEKYMTFDEAIKYCLKHHKWMIPNVEDIQNIGSDGTFNDYKGILFWTGEQTKDGRMWTYEWTRNGGVFLPINPQVKERVIVIEKENK